MALGDISVKFKQFHKNPEETGREEVCLGIATTTTMRIRVDSRRSGAGSECDGRDASGPGRDGAPRARGLHRGPVAARRVEVPGRLGRGSRNLRPMARTRVQLPAEGLRGDASPASRD